MRTIAICTLMLISATPAEAQSQGSASATLQTFLQATTERDFTAAGQCLDFTGIRASSAMNPEPTFLDRERAARALRQAIDRLQGLNAAAVSDEPLAPPVQLSGDPQKLSIVLARGGDGLWRFTPETISRLIAASPPSPPAPQSRLTLLTEQLFGLLSTRLPVFETSLGSIAWNLAILLFALALGRILRATLGKASRKLEEQGKELWAVALGAFSRSVYLAVFTLALATAVQGLGLAETSQKAAMKVVECLTAVTIGYVVWRLVDVVICWLARVSAQTASRLDDMLIPLVSKCLRAAIVVLVLAQVATTLSDQPVTSVLAGLGIGGLAVGLAAQDTIKNLFGSVMIFSDRPFEMGDRIVVDGHDGPVEMVGFRSTRIRTSDGHLVTIPNGELANKTILNMGKPPQLKRSLTVKLEIGTPPEKVQQAVQILKEILKDHEGLQPKRTPSVIFTEIAEQSLNIAVTYFYSPPDAAKFAALNERVNFEILRRFKEAEIQLATASQTLHLAPESKSKLVTAAELHTDTPQGVLRPTLGMHDPRQRRLGA